MGVEMSVISLFILIVVVVLLGWLLIWILGMLAPGHPGIIDNIIWVVVVLVVIFYLLSALGITGGGPTVPRVR